MGEEKTGIFVLKQEENDSESVGIVVYWNCPNKVISNGSWIGCFSPGESNQNWNEWCWAKSNQGIHKIQLQNVRPICEVRLIDPNYVTICKTSFKTKSSGAMLSVPIEVKDFYDREGPGIRMLCPDSKEELFKIAEEVLGKQFSKIYDAKMNIVLHLEVLQEHEVIYLQ